MGFVSEVMRKIDLEQQARIVRRRRAVIIIACFASLAFLALAVVIARYFGLQISLDSLRQFYANSGFINLWAQYKQVFSGGVLVLFVVVAFCLVAECLFERRLRIKSIETALNRLS